MCSSTLTDKRLFLTLEKNQRILIRYKISLQNRSNAKFQSYVEKIFFWNFFDRNFLDESTDFDPTLHAIF